MTSPASASFPWSQAPEPPSGEFRTGNLPVAPGGEYIAARGARPGPALLILASPAAGYGAIHGLFRLAGVLDARRLAGSLLIRLAPAGPGVKLSELVEPSDALVTFDDLRADWRELPVVRYAVTDAADVDHRSEQMAANSGAPYRYAQPSPGNASDPASVMAKLGLPAAAMRFPSNAEGRAETVEGIFQGLINTLRGLGMLEGELLPVESTALQPPAFAESPVDGYWSPAARPGQRLRIDDRLGSFHDGQGRELGDLLTNISGILLGISHEVWVEAGHPVAELARPTN